MQKTLPRIAPRTFALLLAAAITLAGTALAALPSPALAAVSSVETAEVTPSYPNPVTGEIEDPGDPNMVAMAESMMEGVTYPYALMETDVDGNVFVSLRFNLADQENGVTMEASADGTDYVAAPGEMVAENAEDNTADWRFQVPAGTRYLRSHLGVIPIDREVIYFLVLGDAIEGNSAGFTQTVTPGEGAEEPAASSDAAASAGAAASAESATASEDAPAAEPAADDTAPAAGDVAEEGIVEYNAEGRDVTGGANEQPGLDGGTIALVVGIAVAVAVVAGIVVLVAYVRPKRARQAAAAAAAAGTPNGEKAAGGASAAPAEGATPTDEDPRA